MITLCGIPLSNYHNKVKMALLEKGIAFEERLVKPGSPETLPASPMGKVPFLLTPQGSLCESQAIVEWLEASHPEPRLLPADPWYSAKLRGLNLVLELHVELVARQLYPQAFFNTPLPEKFVERVRRQLEKGEAAQGAQGSQGQGARHRTRRIPLLGPLAHRRARAARVRVRRRHRPLPRPLRRHRPRAAAVGAVGRGLRHRAGRAPARAHRGSRGRAGDDEPPDIVTLDLATRRKRALTEHPNTDDAGPAYSPDGTALVFHSYDTNRSYNDQGWLTLHDRRTARMRPIASGFDRGVSHVQWAPDSRSLLFTAEEAGRVRLP